MLKTFYISLALYLAPQNTIALENDKCLDIVKKTVVASEFITPGQSFSELKQLVIKQANEIAVGQVSGTEVRKFSKLSLSKINGINSMNFDDQSTDKIKGRSSSYNIVDQKIIDMGAGKVLEMTIDVDVCIQDQSKSKDILLIGDFIHNGKQFPKFNNAIKSVFSQQSNSFELGSGHPSESYYDIIITGKIDNIAREKKVDKKAMEDAQGMAIFQGFLGAMNQGKEQKNNPFANIFNSASNNTAALNRVNVKVIASVSASHVTENRIYSASAISEQEVSEDSVATTVDSLAFDAIKKASKDLYIKLNSNAENFDIMNLLDY
jgi:hypothetical protein